MPEQNASRKPESIVTLLPIDYEGDLAILGVTLGGQVFRPGDWADRLVGLTESFGGKRAAIATHVYISTKQGQRCVVVEKALAEHEPRLFRFYVSFARENELQVVFEADAPASMLPSRQKEIAG